MKNDSFLSTYTHQPAQLLTESEYAVRSSHAIEIAKLQAAETLGWFSSIAAGMIVHLYSHSYVASALVVAMCICASKMSYAKAVHGVRTMSAEAVH